MAGANAVAPGHVDLAWARALLIDCDRGLWTVDCRSLQNYLLPFVITTMKLCHKRRTQFACHSAC